MDSTVVGSYNPGAAATSFVDYTASFTATASTHSLSFVGTDLATGDNTVFVDNVRIAVVAAPDGGSTLPNPWRTQGIGPDGAAGDASYDGGNVTLIGAGTGVGGTEDSFRFLYQPSSGDCSNTVRVTSLGDATPEAATGVMIRESMNDDATEAGVWVTPDQGIVFTARTKTGGTTRLATEPCAAVPVWLRIERSANLFRAYYSTDGQSWTQVGPTRSIKMSSSAYIGMGVNSGDGDLLNSSTMDHATTAP
jgi:regulation of enolase protein 1 (concanavalin A-like superfamily)